MSDAQRPPTPAPAPDDAARADPAQDRPGLPVRGHALLRAVEVMEALRAPDGDAWTHRQSHASLARYLLEETHEVLEVIDDPGAHGTGALADELGDLLFQILFHARVAADEARAPFDVDDVAAALIDKLVRRNPHVFGDAPARTLREIEAQWQAIKATERADQG